MELVRTSLRLLPIAIFSVSLFAVDRLQPIEVAWFPAFASAIAFDYNGYGYVSHGRFISRLASDGKHAVWAETGAPRGHKILPDGTPAPVQSFEPRSEEEIRRFQAAQKRRQQRDEASK